MAELSKCIFCITDPLNGSYAVEAERIIAEYTHWWLILQTSEKRAKTKQAAGMLVAKRHIESVTEARLDEASELLTCIPSAAQLLCDKVGSEYTGQETVGFNQGPEAGQTVMHAHVHILPVSKSDPEELKVRGGIGGAFEALRQQRIS